MPPAVMVIIILLGFVSLYFYLTQVQNQSVRSKVFGILLRWISKRTFPNNQEEYNKFIKERSIQNAKPYVLPESISKKYGIVKERYNGMDVYNIKTKNGKIEKQILYLHGGGYVFQAENYQWKWICKITNRTNAAITVPMYPLAPNHQFHETFEKIMPIYENLITKTDPKHIVIIGDSAGGGLSLSLALHIKEKGLPQPGNIILLYPWLDITMRNPEIIEIEDKAILSKYSLVQMGKEWAGNTSPNHFLLSPINGELKGLGPISLFIGGYDIFLPDCRKFRDQAKQQGVYINYFEYTKQLHLFTMMPIPEGKKATNQVIDIINKI